MPNEHTRGWGEWMGAPPPDKTALSPSESPPSGWTFPYLSWGSPNLDMRPIPSFRTFNSFSRKKFPTPSLPHPLWKKNWPAQKKNWLSPSQNSAHPQVSKWTTQNDDSRRDSMRISTLCRWQLIQELIKPNLISIASQKLTWHVRAYTGCLITDLVK